MGRIISGLLIAPPFPAVLAALAVVLSQQTFDTELASAIAFGCLLGGYPAAFLIALPLSFMWRRMGWDGPKGIALLGIISAACVSLLVAVLLAPGRNNTPWYVGFMNLLIFTSPLGAVGGLAFWWFGFRTDSATRDTHKVLP